MEFDKDIFRVNLNKFTQKAFRSIPPLNNPVILDIGCGTGIPTLTLAKLTKGHITAVDIDKIALERLAKRARDSGLADYIRIHNQSMKNLKFDSDRFDFIWAEGSIMVIGFKKGLTEWKKFLKPKGYMVIHDDLKDLSKKKDIITQCGYNLIHYFVLDENIWWKEYYDPMEREILRLQSSDIDLDESGISVALEEIRMFKMNPKSCASVFFVMQLM